ncbi:MAG TPA: hypothetical protein VEF89_33710 [Solirubrobacteraceae bacterium]|nr:hypothetical protein [Solirubrobacteraceae bacterium]
MRKWLTERRSKSPAGALLFAVIGLVVSVATVVPAAAHDRSGNHRPGHHHADHGRGHGRGGSGQFTNTVFASGATIMHPGPKGPEAISQPDDITYLDGHIFVGFQNGVGPQGEPSSTTGNTDSTIVEFNRHGDEVNQWDVVGKCDGLTADPEIHRVIATVNEDANSSLYTIDPHGSGSGSVVHYSYNESLPSNGGTDAISIYHGMILISASAPGTTGAAAPQPTYPAVYRVTLDSSTDVATVQPLFYDEDSATVANRGSAQYGSTVSLALTDPDSNEVVPFYARRFAGDFMLTSQGDKQQIFVRDAGTRHQSLSVLNLSDSVDDTAWPSDRHGAIFTTDNSNNTINEITGPFYPGQVFVADTPCDANDAPSVCPAQGFPPNFLGQLNPDTGTITAVTLQGPAVEPQGMLFHP